MAGRIKKGEGFGGGRFDLIQERRAQQQIRVTRLCGEMGILLRGQWRVVPRRCRCGRNHYALESQSTLGTRDLCPVTFWARLAYFCRGEFDRRLEDFVFPIINFSRGAPVSNNTENALALFDEMSQLQVGELTEKDRIQMGKQVMAILPPNARISDPRNAFIYGMYCISSHRNVLRGPYAWEEAGKLYISEPYKIEVNWAQKIHPFNEWYEDELAADREHLEEGDIVSRCFILLKENRDFFYTLVERMDLQTARKMACSSAVGVITERERYRTGYYDKQTRRWVEWEREEWKPLDPPKGWTWRQKAQKRALRNAIRISHGEPTTSDLQALAMTVRDVETIPSDWKEVRAGAGTFEAEETARAEAVYREHKEEWDALTPEEQGERFEENQVLLYGEFDDPLDPELIKERGGEPGPVETTPEVRELTTEVGIILADLASGEQGERTLIEDGRHRFKVQRLHEWLGLGIPRWPATVGEISAAFRSVLQADNEENAADDEEAEPVDESGESDEPEAD